MDPEFRLSVAQVSVPGLSNDNANSTGFMVFYPDQVRIDSLAFDPELKSLTIQLPLEHAKFGYPRAMLDHDDSGFMVFADGDRVTYEENSQSPSYRVITLPIDANVHQMKITGTYAVPEFGPLVLAMVIWAAIGSIVVRARLKGITTKFWG